MITLNTLIALLTSWSVILVPLILLISKHFSDKQLQQIKTHADVEMSKLQGEIAKNNNSLTSLIGLYGTSYHQANERRIKSIETIWQNFLSYCAVIPEEAFDIFDKMNERAINEFWTDRNAKLPNAINLKDRLSKLKMDRIDGHKSFILNMKKEQPFIGETTWSIVELHIAFITRITFLLIKGVEDKELKHWHHDFYLQKVFQERLSVTENELIYKKHQASLMITCNLLENKILVEIEKMLSGENISKNALERMNTFKINLFDAQKNIQPSA